MEAGTRRVWLWRSCCALTILIIGAAFQNVWGRFAVADNPPLQMIVVTSENWDDLHAIAQRYERSSENKRWRAVGAKFPVVLGKTGLGWGRGMVDTSGLQGPVKKEGDGKAPAGMFRLTEAFGYDASPLAHSGMPYFAITNTSECVDDTHSSHYNQLLDARKVAKDWNSSEMMLRPDNLYRWGAYVAHNSEPSTPGGGSCIFLHIWRGPDQGTVGCTAMEQANIEVVLRWLDPRRNPVLLQMPKAEYQRLRAAWGLP